MPEDVLDQELEQDELTVDGADEPADDAPLDDVVDEAAELDTVILEGEEPEPEDTPKAEDSAVIRGIRDRNKALKKELKEKEARLAALEASQTQPKADDIGPEPNLDDKDIDYDKELFKKKLLEWNAKKQKADEVANRAKVQQEAQLKAWNDKIATYDKAKRGLRVRDFDDAEDLVKEMFSQAQLSIIIDGAKHPEEIIYALGKRPELAKKMASEKNLARFTMEIGVLETKVQSTRKTAPAPEKPVRANSGSAIAASNTLKALEERAAKTGNRTELIAWKRKHPDAK